MVKAFARNNPMTWNCLVGKNSCFDAGGRGILCSEKRELKLELEFCACQFLRTTTICFSEYFTVSFAGWDQMFGFCNPKKGCKNVIMKKKSMVVTFVVIFYFVASSSRVSRLQRNFTTWPYSWFSCRCFRFCSAFDLLWKSGCSASRMSHSQPGHVYFVDCFSVRLHNPHPGFRLRIAIMFWSSYDVCGNVSLTV